ncbi:MAG: transglutaminase family protein [Muribaculaceae bacterium]
MKKRFGLVAMLVMVAIGATAALKDTVEKDFLARKAEKSVSGVLNKVESLKLTADEQTAMKFLYAYMPLPDLTDYSVDFYKMNVDYALRTRKEMSWGSKIPDREFYHFVLPVRINNENLDESRRVFFDELKERVKGMSMRDAALEVNHWCHEKVSYRPSDSRTSSPLASVRTAFGRCGEESTFGVAAMRAVGIPARQVYTPRWAHTDDNHAWVEVWIDGEWQFLGACEPEPVLNLGWFNAPASRGMMMHTKAFGRYEGPEDVMSKSNCFTEINVTENYAPVAKAVVRVVDEKGAPVSARVDFKVYNYAELYTVCRKQSDENGYTYVTSGLGDLVVWASKDKKFGIKKCSVGRQDTLVVTLDKTMGYEGTIDLDLVPPVERNTVPPLTQEQISTNQKRFVYEDSLRAAYEATFVHDDKAKEYAQKWNLPVDKVTHFLVGSRGNYANIISFIENAGDKQRALNLLDVISEKDLRDVSLEVLNDHFYNTPDCGGDNSKFYFENVMNPRIDNEMIEPYKAYLQEAFKKLKVKEFKADPYKWADWVKANIKVIKDWNPQSLRMMPTKVWQFRCSDADSRDMFFVAGARAMGIYARKDLVTGKVQWASAKDEWHDVQFESTAQVNNAQGSLNTNYEPSGRLEDPKYYYHFTISKIENGYPVLLNYPEEGYDKIFKNGTKLDVGNYVLTSGTRLGDGSVLARLCFFNMNEQQATTNNLTFRTSDTDVQVIGNFNSEDKYYDFDSKKEKSLLSTTGRGYYIIGLINPGHEPSNHALHDIESYAADFEKWGQKIVLLFANEDASKRHKWAEFKKLPNTVVYGTDLNEAIANEIKSALNLESDNRPIFLIADTFNRVLFVSQGYTIGLGEQMIKVIDKLNEKK